MILPDHLRGVSVGNYELKFPDEYDDFALEYKAKGWVSGVVLFFEGAEYRLNIYTPERLLQDVEDELPSSLVFFESNLMIVPVVDRPSIEAAVRRLIGRGDLAASMCASIT